MSSVFLIQGFSPSSLYCRPRDCGRRAGLFLAKALNPFTGIWFRSNHVLPLYAHLSRARSNYIPKQANCGTKGAGGGVEHKRRFVDCKVHCSGIDCHKLTQKLHFTINVNQGRNDKRAHQRTLHRHRRHFLGNSSNRLVLPQRRSLSHLPPALLSSHLQRLKLRRPNHSLILRKNIQIAFRRQSTRTHARGPILRPVCHPSGFFEQLLVAEEHSARDVWFELSNRWGVSTGSGRW